MNEDLIFRGALLLGIAVIAYLIYRWRSQDEYWQHTDEPVIFDGREEAQLIEAASVFEQRKSGRELGGPITVITDGKNPRNFSAQLALKSIRDKVDIREAKSDD